MDRVGKIVTAATKLSRLIWASLPLLERYTEFFIRCASTLTDGFGKAVYAEFLIKGVPGMPEVHGLDLSRRPLANYLPSGYGRAFGEKVFRTLMRKTHDPQLTNDIMMSYLTKFLDKNTVENSTTLVNAEQYVFTGIMRQLIDMKRKKREVSDVYFDGEEERHHEVSVVDEDSVEQQLKHVLPRIEGALKRIHPDAPLYVQKSIIEGYPDVEIIPDMLTHPFSSTGKPLTAKSWNTLVKGKILEVLKKAFADLQ